MPQTKKKIAVFMGGRSPEHDVSVISGLQVLKALDPEKYDSFPVYISPQGEWLTGDPLRRRDNFLPDAGTLKSLTPVTLDVRAAKTGRLLPLRTGLFGRGRPLEFDVAVLVFHGLHGEDGGIQGMLDVAGIPYTGMRTMATSVLMDKAATKLALQGLGIPCLDYTVIRRPAEGYIVEKPALRAAGEKVGFPCIVKPVHLGSSIGVAKCDNVEELAASLPAIFEYDDAAILEPFVENLVEYNVAVANLDGTAKISAFERPKTTEELLDFKQKYMSGGDDKTGGGSKEPGQMSEGMLSLTRELNPPLPDSVAAELKRWACTMFEALDGSGAPRIDFIGNEKTGEFWLNEVNPIPGSFGYFLWEAAPEPLLFGELCDHLIKEALFRAQRRTLPRDPVPVDARLLKRHA